ncbi:MAG: 50S ribosomal protein L17 [Candidatus Midichloria mitochondrii]|uniref:Large ribosomal subunit protein bL17 n=1 Tax=Midichloria mitochondrii (strain IricVA) TaxID=696127 RepID=F7XUM4_MIDMI|nr:50S ribosomal protein L17 [Candidatus Midichloria mitochondrii]AEI88373.1 ribosomal protein L17 [Candidatus Midichloria mitochondrii IricVA]MDJ1256336.1 50S ribosomal protein L17 [Candidatus Midichloria mitochondrii]MDJ1288042.1 50S ribosomal protein L17 [Candidatus Midichloria mitochondrii]MDJ1298880.1 50S ribosomal protein L17 [Candidatus Midichloria mitochondrii]MDJ1313096.1 50S ribosomal protein L17 [Candidatus Midichloria mitochondrii]
MNHGISGRKFGRYSGHRKSLLVNLAKELIEHEQIITTVYKAKDVRPVVEKLVTLAKKGDLHSRRRALSFFYNDEIIVSKLFDKIASRYSQRNGGYLRIIKAGFRKGDCAPIAVIEFVDRDITAKKGRVIPNQVQSNIAE